MKSIDWIWNHRDEIAAIVTYLMTSIVLGIRGFRGFATGLRALSRWTAIEWDDGIADRIYAFAGKLDRIADRVAAWHARIAPPNPTPHYEAVAAGTTTPDGPRARSSIGSRGQ